MHKADKGEQKVVLGFGPTLFNPGSQLTLRSAGKFYSNGYLTLIINHFRG
jgi:hypothetical protein